MTNSTTAPSLAKPSTGCCGHHDAFAILHDCHEHILARLARLESLAGELLRSPSLDETHLAVLGDVLAFLHVAIPMHSADEEQTLFPRLRAALGEISSGRTPMDCMEQEHGQHQALLLGLERAVVRRDAAALARAASAVVSAYREHIGKEEEVLFPWARKTLADPRVVAAMTAEMRQRRIEAGLLGC